MNVSRNLLFTLILIGFTTSNGLWAQTNPASLAGQVIDAQTGDPMEYATVAIFDAKGDSVLNGALTDANGKFKVKDLPPTLCKAEINFIGYTPLVIDNIQLTVGNKANASLGKIRLQPTGVAIGDVEINAQQDFMVQKIDRKVYNASQILTADGGTVNEILENIPSVEVDLSGNVSLRGSGNVNILIDGKPSTLTGGSRQAILDQIPANSVERIEVMTNPSAKYAPDGMTGIINIVLKKNRKSGYNGNVSLGAGTWFNKYTASTGLSFRNSKFNVYGNYYFRDYTRGLEGSVYRSTTLGDTTSYLDQEITGGFDRKVNLIKSGIDLYLTPKQTLSLAGNVGLRGVNRNNYVSYQELDQDQNLDQWYYRDNVEEGGGYNYDLNLNHHVEFKREGQELFTSLNYSESWNEDTDQFAEAFLNLDGTANASIPDLQNNYLLSENQIISAQLDYTHPFSEKLKLETGLLNYIRSINNDFSAESFDPVEQRYVSDTLLNNNFLYEEQNYAAYATLGGENKKLGYLVGLRAEQTLSTSQLLDTDESFKNEYFSLFPSAFLTYEMPQEYTLNFSYGRRLNRPSIQSLNPFTDYSDPRNLRIGNPFLRPEYINAFELGLTHTFKEKLYLNTSLYYRHIDDVIQRIITYDSSGTTVSQRTNFSTASNMGLEVITVYKVLEKWNLNLSGNVYRTQTDGSNLLGDLTNDAFSFNTKLVSTAILPGGLRFQFTAKYKAPLLLLQGSRQGMFSMDAALQKQFLNRRLRVNLRVSDLTNGRFWQSYSEGPGFTQQSIYDRESRIGFLSASWSFGREFKGRKKRRQNGGKKLQYNSDDPDIF